jgi:hypothetical protein
MGEAPPAETTPGAEKKRRFFHRVPTSLIVTFVGIALTAWLLPAFTRQWDDRQKARELKAAIADEIAIDTSRMLSAGFSVAEAQKAQVRGRRVSAASAFWDPASLRMAIRLRAYFPQNIVKRWSAFSYGVNQYLVACAYASPPSQPLDTTLPESYRRMRLADWLRHYTMGHAMDQDTIEADVLDATDNRPADRLGVIESGRIWLRVNANTLISSLFAAHTAGFSTTRGDLLRDLLP